MTGSSLQAEQADFIRTAQNGHSVKTGTVRAKYTDAPNCDLAQPSRGSKSGRGGARNRADRTSDTLSDEQALELIDATTFAITKSCAFQSHWTVHYGLAGIEPEDGARFVGKLLDLVSKQARREGGQLTAIWVRERASGKGEHVHIMLHLPDTMDLRNRTNRWIKVAGGKIVKGVSKVRSIGGRLGGVAVLSDTMLAEHYRTNAENVVRHLLKGAGADIGGQLGLTRYGEAGRIIGKR